MKDGITSLAKKELNQFFEVSLSGRPGVDILNFCKQVFSKKLVHFVKEFQILFII